jgi:hypothetical protein
MNGIAARNGKLEVHKPDPRGGTMAYTPTVLVAERDRKLRWLSRSEADVFNGEHGCLMNPFKTIIIFTSSKGEFQGQWLNRLKVALHLVSQKK